LTKPPALAGDIDQLPLGITTVSMCWIICFTLATLFANSGCGPTVPPSAVTPAAARDYYVSRAGNDANDGSVSRPWATIQHAAETVQPGSVVHVAPGTYSGPIMTRANGNANARIRFISDQTWAAHIVSTGLLWDPNKDVTTGPNVTWENEGSYVDILGFDIKGDGHIGIYNTGSFVNIQGNNIHNILAPSACSNPKYTHGSAGIDSDHGTDVDVIGNFIHDLGDGTICNSGAHGIYYAYLRGHIQNNLIINVQGYSIHTYHKAAGITIANNTVIGGYGGIIVSASRAEGGVADKFVVTNNIVVGETYFGIREYESTGKNNRYCNNLISHSGTNLDLMTGINVSTRIQDPLFVNQTGRSPGDFHLQSASPAVDGGTPEGAPMTDFDGVKRPQGSAWDIGAYEFIPGSVSSATAQYQLRVSSNSEHVQQDPIGLR